MGNYVNQIKVAPGGRHTGTAATQYTFAAAQTLIFVIPDNVLGDNNGGLSVLISPAVGVPGDYNANGTVDAADYVLWRNYQGTTQVLPNDPTGGIIGTTQYTTWRSHFGQTSGSGAWNVETLSAVPEPAAMTLISAASLLAAVRRNYGVRNRW
jgi:hypothetical protein